MTICALLIKRSDLQEITIDHVNGLMSVRTAPQGLTSMHSIDGIRVLQGKSWEYVAACNGAWQFCGIRQTTNFNNATVILLWSEKRAGVIKEIRERGEIIFKNNEENINEYISAQRSNQMFGRVICFATWIGCIWLIIRFFRVLTKES